MALSVETLLSLMALFFFMVANKVHSQSSTSFSFTFFDPNPTDLIYQGDAHVPNSSQNLRLTKTDSWCTSQTMSVGRVLYSSPIQLYNRFTAGREVSFSTQIQFRHRVTSGGGADGFAFFIAPVGTIIPCGYCSNGGNLGIYNSSSTTPPIFAVEIDTFPNPEWDPEYPHLGININSRESRKVTRLNSSPLVEPFIGLIYNATTKNVQTTVVGITDIISYDIDLTTVLPEWVQVGISATTGSDQSNLGVYELVRWTFSAQIQPTGVSLHDKMIIHPQYDHLAQEYLRRT